MAVTLTSLQEDVLSRLNEALNSPAGALQTGTGGTPAIATLDTITGLLNEAAADIARTCFPLSATATFTAVVLSVPSEFSLPFSQLPGGTGFGNLWAARKVFFQPPGGAYAELERTSRKIIDTLYPTLVTDAPAAPAYWYPEGGQGIGIAPKPSAAGEIAVNGLALPPPLVNSSDTVTWLDSDLTRYLAYYAAAFLAKRNLEDPSLSSRYETWWGDYLKGKASLFDRTLRQDPSTAAAFYPEMLAMAGSKSA